VRVPLRRSRRSRLLTIVVRTISVSVAYHPHARTYLDPTDKATA